MFNRWRKRRNCMHHESYYDGCKTWLQWQLINTGAGKMFWCTKCGKIWVF